MLTLMHATASIAAADDQERIAPGLRPRSRSSAGSSVGKSRTSRSAVLPQRSVALIETRTSLEPNGISQDQRCSSPSSVVSSARIMPVSSDRSDRVRIQAEFSDAISVSGRMTGGFPSPVMSTLMHAS